MSCAATALVVLAGCPAANVQSPPIDMYGDDLLGTNADGLPPFALLPAQPPGTAYDIDCTSATTCYVVGDLATPVFYRTTDRGASWPEMTLPISPIAGLTQLLVSVRFASAQVGYALGYSMAAASPIVTVYLLGTTDGGASWRQLPAAGLPPAAQAVPAQIALDGSTVWVVLHGPAVGLPATGLYQSTDGGSTFTQAVRAVPMVTLADYSNLACDGSGSCVSGDTTMLNTPIFLYTTDGFATAPTVAMLAGATGGIGAVRALGGGRFVAIGAQAIYASSDSGASWSSVMATSGALQALDCTAAGLCYVGGAAATLLQSGASGQAYAAVALPPKVTSVKRVRIAGPSAVYLLTDQGVALGPN